MPIQFVGLNGGGANSTGVYYFVRLNTLVGGIAPAASVGDFIIAVHGLTGATATPVGLNGSSITWTNTTVVATTNPFSAVKARISYGFLTGAASQVYFYAQGNGASMIYVFRGVNTANPLDVAIVSASGDGTTVDSPSITTSTASAQIAAFGFVGFPAGTTLTAPSVPSGYNGFSYVAVSGSGTRCMAMLAKRPDLPPAGTVENPGVFPLANTTNATWIGFTAALRDAAAAASGGNGKIWNGTSWVAKPVKVWNGSAWVTKPVKRWNGTAWVTTPY